MEQDYTYQQVQEGQISPATKELIELGIISGHGHTNFREVPIKKKEDLKKHKDTTNKDLLRMFIIGIIGIVVLSVLAYFWIWTLWITIPLEIFYIVASFICFMGVCIWSGSIPGDPDQMVAYFESLLQFDFDDNFRFFDCAHGGCHEEIILLSDSDCSKLQKHMQQTETPLKQIRSGVYQQYINNDAEFTEDKFTLDLNRKAFIHNFFTM